MNRASAYRFARGASLSVAVVVALLVAAALLPRVQAQSSTSEGESRRAGNAENGKKIYNSHGCYQCHNYVANGGRAGPQLGPKPIPFSAFSRYIRQPRGQMPPYTSKIISDAELADIYAFLQSLPQPPAVKDIPLLND